MPGARADRVEAVRVAVARRAMARGSGWSTARCLQSSRRAGARDACAMPGLFTVASRPQTFIDPLPHALHARSRCRAGGQGQEEAQSRNCRGHRDRSGFAQREPPKSVSAGLRAREWIISCGPRLPVPEAQWLIAVPLSLTVAWAAPALHPIGVRTGFPFHPRNRDVPGTPKTAQSVRGTPRMRNSARRTARASAPPVVAPRLTPYRQRAAGPGCA